MCGVSFYLSANGDHENSLSSSLKKMVHRGPDNTASVNGRLLDRWWGVGHNRLSIIDVSKRSNQPMKSKCGEQIISYNGEIYNYQSLKADHLFDYSFETKSDTEVIVALYEKYGVEAFKLLRGMFAFVLLDISRKKVYIVRDLLGVKPIYFYSAPDFFAAASEIKGLSTYENCDFSISDLDVFEFFNHGFVYEPGTGFEKIKKVAPGCFVEICIETLAISESKYISWSDIEDRSTALALENAISDQELADVPVGVFFSGGTDSAIIGSFSSSKNFLFARYNSDDLKKQGVADDFEYARSIAQELNGELTIEDFDSDASNFLSQTRFVVEGIEELISDFTFMPVFNLSRIARINGFKVMLSGMGGDEVFGGYPRYRLLKYQFWMRALSNIVGLLAKFNLKDGKLRRIRERMQGYFSESEFLVGYSRLLGYMSTSDLKCLFSDYKEKNARFIDRVSSYVNQGVSDKDTVLQKAKNLDLYGFLSHNLVVNDKASMLASVEVRVPLLAEEVVKTGHLEDSYEQISFFRDKIALKNILSKKISNNNVNRPKSGFNPPLEKTIEEIGKSGILKLIGDSESIESFINKESAFDIVNRHFSGESFNAFKIWQLIFFVYWCDWAKSIKKVASKDYRTSPV